MLFAVLAFGCSSSKSKKTPLPKRAYHNITARNNAYFNATLIFKTVQNNMTTSRVEDFDEVLPIYTDRDPALASSYSSDLDEVIKKASIDIQKHEPSKYTDNNYLLIGQTYFLKGEFNSALETFQYVNTEFKEKPNSPYSKKKKKKKKSSKKKKKKKKGSPMTSAQVEAQHQQELKEKRDQLEEEQTEGKTDPLHWLKHQPVRNDALIWIANTYTAMGKYKEAEAVFTIIDADEEFPNWLIRDREIARANFYLTKGDLDKAIEPLNFLIEDIHKKRKKTRYHYILAQIYERLGNNASAVDEYKLVLKGRPKYDFAFNAKMNIARIAAKDNSMELEDIIKLLKKMLKEKKNAEFYDQIYYALADLSLREGHKDDAISYLEKSIETSVSNNKQKAQSYIRLAELYFEDEEYVKAQPNYEEALKLIDPEYEGYAQVNSRNDILKNLVTQLNIISEQDSLLEIYGMTDAEREQLVENILEQREKEQEKKNDVANNSQFQNNNNTKNDNSSSSGGDWYFYNTSAKSLGYNDFIRKWGKRKLEDNWRRSDKSSFEELDTQAPDSTGADTNGPSDYLTERDKLLKELTPNEEMVASATGKVVDAYFKVANIFRFELLNYPKAIDTYEELLKRFPGNQYEAECYYNLYLLYEKQGDTEKANYYKDLLLKGYPNSKMAQMIRDPNYLEASNKLKDEVTKHYLATFQLYKQNRLEDALNQIHFADSAFAGNNYLRPQYDLLEAFVIGQTQDLKDYKKALENIVRSYPTNEVKDRAEEILKFIESSEDSTIMYENNMLRYEYNPDSRHFVMIAFKGKGIKLTELTTRVAQYNDANYSLTSLEIDPLILPDGNNLLLIKSFENLAAARKYYTAISQYSQLSEGYPEGALSFYMISDVNFNKIIINKEANTYFDFFNLKYIK